jgi:hypothetical protein
MELESRTLVAPFIPKIGDNFDKNYCEGIDIMGQETLDRYQKIQNCGEYNTIFINYTFISLDIRNSIKKPEIKVVIVNKSTNEPKYTRASPFKIKSSFKLFDQSQPPKLIKTPFDTPRTDIKLPPIDLRKLTVGKLIASSSTSSMLKNSSTRSSLDSNILSIHKKSSSLIDKKFK